MPIEYDVVPERIGKEQVTAYLDAKIEHLRELVRNRPRPPITDDLMETAVQSWWRKFMAYYGKALGNIEFARNFGVITPEHATQLENGIKALIQFHVGAVVLGR